ncbi:MAG: hypothetical protein AAFX54_07835 [Pseudomonadota bacterium]
MQSIVIPGDQTSTVRINVGQAFTELTANSNDSDAIGIDLVGGQAYRITLDPATEAFLQTVAAGSPTLASKDPLIQSILDSAGSIISTGDDDSGSGAAAALIFTPAVSGTYFIVSGNGDTGWWTLEVNEFTAPVDDFSNALDASNPIGIGETQDGHIGIAGDTDTIAISLTAGVAVDITLYGNDVGFFGELADTEIISFVDAGGVAVNPALLEAADAFSTFTSGGNADAHQISLTPAVSGNYFITVGAGPGEAVGDYSISVSGRDRGVFSIRENEEFGATGNPEVDMFFLENFAATDGIVYTDRNGDGATTLTYSLPSADPGFSPAKSNVINSAWTNGFTPATGLVRDAWLGMMDHISSFSKVDFVEVPDNGVEAGTLRIGTTELILGSASGALITGWAGAPGWTIAGETWINLTKGAENVSVIQNFGATELAFDNFILNRTLHEFGHAFGLNHPDFSTLSNGVDPSLLGQEYSIMSRAGFSAFPGSVVSDLFPQTLMWFDIQALQAAYGLDTVTTAGADAYTIDTSARSFRTIWDYAGQDTLVLNGVADTVINLTPGTWQDVGTEITHYDATGAALGVERNTVFIAPDTVLEIVQAGGGNDRITGNSGANVISGNDGLDTIDGGGGPDALSGERGHDSLSGSNGNDTLLGGAGKDVLSGGKGFDYLLGGDQGDILSGDELNDTLDGGGGSDTLNGGDGDDLILGGSGRDVIDGGSGEDSIDAAAGDDTIDAGGGGDSVFVGTGADLGFGNNGNDTLSGAQGKDTLEGGKGFDYLLGGDDGDFLNGGALNDTLVGDAGNDSLDGGDGDDRILGGSGRDTIMGAAGNDEIDAGSGADNVDGGAQRDNIFGGSGADTLIGGGGNDTLSGGDQNDTIIGGNGFDVLLGGVGDDLLEGGNLNDILLGQDGDDTFVFSPGGAVDTIRDFVAGAATDDVIKLVGFEAAFDTFAEVIAVATDDGTDTIIDFGGGDMIIIEGVVVGDYDPDDFVFG